MSFGINGPSQKPMIQESQHTQDGSGGNLGYFQRGKQKKKKEDDELDTFQFSNEEDTFGEENIEEDEDSPAKQLKDKIKGFFKKQEN